MAQYQESAGDTQRKPPAENRHPVPSERIEAAVKSIRYGVVQVIVQDGRVVQIDTTEKTRLV